MTGNNFELIYKSSVPLRSLNENMIPTGMASGCLIDYKGERILLTVQHATGNQKNWGIEVGYEEGKGTKFYQLGAMNFLRGASIDDLKFKDIDFSYVGVPTDILPYRQEADKNGVLTNKGFVTVFKPDFNIDIDSNEKFGFSGNVRFSKEEHKGTTYLASEFKVYENLSFIRMESEYYVFKLPMKHPGHDDFCGCSGAPVIDTKGRVFALVCKGDENADEIYAISIKKYRVALDIFADNLI